jgi:hypothetical protein
VAVLVDLYQQLVQPHIGVAVMVVLVAEAEVVTPLMTEMVLMVKDMMVGLVQVHLLEVAVVVPLNKVELGEIKLDLVVEEKI